MIYQHNLDEVAAEEFDGEFVVIHFARGTYFSLQNAAVDLWRQLENGSSTSDAADRVLALLSEVPPTARDELLACADRFVEEGLVREAASAGPPPPARANGSYESPRIEVFSDLQELILLDPVHEADTNKGWPTQRPKSRDDG